MMVTSVNKYFRTTTSPAPLAVFRLLFGSLIFLSVIRFWAKGWIEELYIQPAYFFSYFGFEFVKPIGEYTYLIFIICALSALGVAAGLFYRFSIIALFISFTYIELMDKSTYLNHYYFVSMICLLLIFLPAHVSFSLDALRKKSLQTTQVPAWCVDSIKIFVAMLYIFAGLAKVNSDWLLHAQPLRIWLPAKNDLPLIGSLFNYPWVAYCFSWIGCLYDLSVPFLLFNSSTRIFAYGAVIGFHVLTAILFPIGMFPFIMIATALIFFPPAFHEKIIHFIHRLTAAKPVLKENLQPYSLKSINQKLLLTFLAMFFFFQLVFPFRYAFYPDELFWTEEGYRFSWRVMLMEKAGAAQFIVRDDTGKSILVDNSTFLTPLQEKMMATQPDMILQYAHILRDYYAQHGFNNPSVYADTYVTLNGRFGKPLVDPSVDLAKERDSFKHKSWILPFGHEIYGF